MPGPSNYFVVRAGIGVVLLLVCAAILVWRMRTRDQLRAAGRLSGATTGISAPTSLALLAKLQRSDRPCANDCLTALWLVGETRLLLERHSTDPASGVRALAVNRTRLRNPDSQEYPFVIRRAELYGRTVYTFEAHGNRRFVDVPMHDVQTALDATLCPSEVCSARELCETCFAATDEDAKRYAVIHYPWYHQQSENEIEKRSVVYRYSPDVVVGSGYTLRVLPEVPDVPLLAACLAIYAATVAFVFVWPGSLFVHSTRALDRPWCVLFPAVFLTGVGVLMYRHSRSIGVAASVDDTVLNDELQTKRVIAGTLAVMALSFTFIQHTYDQIVVKLALFVSVVLSILAFVDVTAAVPHTPTKASRDTSERAKMAVFHTTSTFVTCSILVLVWLFTFLLVLAH